MMFMLCPIKFVATLTSYTVDKGENNIFDTLPSKKKVPVLQNVFMKL